jgi:hypothetical protein
MCFQVWNSRVGGLRVLYGHEQKVEIRSAEASVLYEHVNRVTGRSEQCYM